MGNHSAAAVATATATVVNGITGWSMTGSTITGPEAVTIPGTAFASRGSAGSTGCHVRSVAATFQGGLDTCYATHLLAPATGRVVAIDVYLGTTVNGADRPSVALYQGGTTINANGATLLYGAQIPAGQIAADGWARVPIPPSVQAQITSGANLWVGSKSTANQTQVRFLDVGGALLGELTAQNIRVSDGSMAGGAGTAWPSTWAGDTGDSGFGIVLACRLVYEAAPYRGDASWSRRFGMHAAAATLPDQVAMPAAWVALGAPPPDVLGLRLGTMHVALGTVHVGQFSAEVWQGGTDDATSPHNPDPDGATRLHAYGATTGTATGAYVELAAPGSPVAVSSTGVLWLAIWSATLLLTTIRFDQQPAYDVAFDPENPADFYEPTGIGDGSEYEAFAEAGRDVDPPASPFTGHANDTYPGNVPGLYVMLHVDGVSIA